MNEEYQERRVKGYLNAQAYFPWVDQERLRMMDYIVLKPELTIDDGVEAYSFYIRSHLEIEYSEDRFKDYTACLQFYLPETALKHLPLDAFGKRPCLIFIWLSAPHAQIYMGQSKEGWEKLRVYFVVTEKLVEQQLLPIKNEKTRKITRILWVFKLNCLLRCFFQTMNTTPETIALDPR